MIAAMAGATLALGLLVVLRGAFPQQVDLRTRLADFNDHEVVAGPVGESLIGELAVTLLETVKGEDIDEMLSDIAVTDSDFEHIAMEKLKGAGGAAGLLVFASVWFGFVSGAVGVIAVAAIGAVVGYMIPDMELKKKAAARRVEFGQALTAFITLLGSSISGGGGITTAMTDAAAMGEGWVFVKIRDALDEAKLSGSSPWVALDNLGRDLRVLPLIELAGSLTLAGTSGARVTETLHSRAESMRAKELAATRSDSEAKSSSLGLPVGLMLLAWAGFMAYPAIMNLLGFS